MDSQTIEHQPVLCSSVIALLAPKPGDVVLDATVGHGGHAQLLAEKIGPEGRLIGLDVDAANMAKARQRLDQAGNLSPRPRVDLIRSNFSELEPALDSLGVGNVDIILADLGVSTDQLLDSARGLTFTQDGPLDMRLDDRLPVSASDLVNKLTESELSDLLFFNSQERFSRRIAKRICQVRRDGRIRRTSEMVRIICSAMGVSEHGYPGKMHPATRTFLALRMAVNRELENLSALLTAAANRLSPGGRVAVISFHSGEDRIVKQDFLDRQRDGVYEIRTKKPVTPDADEIRRNPRSRSAKLRVAMRAPATLDAA